MPLTLQAVYEKAELKAFITLPWRFYQGDKNWVPPLIEDTLAKLDPARNAFWKTAEYQLWTACRDGTPVGRIGAILDHRRNELAPIRTGLFGFFECEDNTETSRALLGTAETWFKERGVKEILGPYNPSPTDEAGILVEGFDSRPAILEAHNPPYYSRLIEDAGYKRNSELVARHWLRRGDMTNFESAMPGKLARAAALGSRRNNLTIRHIRMQAWKDEIELACRIYNTCLSELPGYLPIPVEEFSAFAQSFKAILDPDMAVVAEVDGHPVGYALALPDVSEALQHIDGKLNLTGMVKFWWYSRKLSRVSVKILMMLPEYQNLGIEAVMLNEIAKVIWRKGFAEVEMSLTGDENEKSNRFQEHLGFQVYRRYRIYQKEL